MNREVSDPNIILKRHLLFTLVPVNALAYSYELDVSWIWYEHYVSDSFYVYYRMNQTYCIMEYKQYTSIEYLWG